MALRNAQGQREKYLTLELSSTSNPVEDMCAIVSKFQSAKIGDEWTILELAHQLQMPYQTLYAWVYKGHLKARRTTRTPHPLWLVHADPAELARLRALRPTPALVRTKTP
jgi:hypothetical protein